ncbi:MAG: serine/threonine-protein kinase [Acidobacteriota bacterium]
MIERLGRYQIKDELGRGSMGIVYRAVDTRLDRVVVLKTLKSDGMPSAERDASGARFKREAQAVGLLSHPGIVQIHELDEDQGELFLAMEYVEGDTLQGLIADGVKLAPREVARLMADVAEALDFAHGKSIIHRDIKPANLLLSKTGRIKVVDFGVARIAASTLTGTGQALGTPHYMSPEQFMGDPLDGRSDLFSLGVVAYQLLTLHHPFVAKDFNTMVHRILTLVPKPPHELSPSVPLALSAVVMKAISKKREDRHARGRELAAALRAAIDGSTPAPEPPTIMFGKAVVAADEATVLQPSSAVVKAGAGFDDPFGSGSAPTLDAGPTMIVPPAEERTQLGGALPIEPRFPTIAPASPSGAPAARRAPPAARRKPGSSLPILWALVALLGAGVLVAAGALAAVVLWPRAPEPKALLEQRRYEELERWALKRMEQNPDDPVAKAYLDLARDGLKAGTVRPAPKVSRIKVVASAPFSGTMSVLADELPLGQATFTASSTIFGRSRPGRAQLDTYIAAGRHRITIRIQNKNGRTNLARELDVSFPESGVATLTVTASPNAIEVSVS